MYKQSLKDPKWPETLVHGLWGLCPNHVWFGTTWNKQLHTHCTTWHYFTSSLYITLISYLETFTEWVQVWTSGGCFKQMAEIWEKCQHFFFKSWLLKLPKTALSIFTCNCCSKKLHKRYINVVIEARKLWNSQRKTCMLLKTINRMFLSCKIHRAGVQCSPTAVRSFFIGIKGECASFSSSSSLVQKLRKFWFLP